MNVTYEDRNGTMYRVVEYPHGGKTEEAIEGRVETIRIDNEIVEDVYYEFDFKLDKYVETNRVTRTDKLPPSRIDQLEDENAFLALELAQTQARLDQAEQEMAGLLLELVSKGVV